MQRARQRCTVTKTTEPSAQVKLQHVPVGKSSSTLMAMDQQTKGSCQKLECTGTSLTALRVCKDRTSVSARLNKYPQNSSVQFLSLDGSPKRGGGGAALEQSPLVLLLSGQLAGSIGFLPLTKPLCWPTVAVSPLVVGCGTNTLRIHAAIIFWCGLQNTVP